MAERHLSNTEFFAKLSELFTGHHNKDHGSVYLTQKRLSHKLDLATTPTKVADDPLWDLNPEQPLPVIVRVTDGKSKTRRGEKTRLSTIVNPVDLDEFYATYADVCKAGMHRLRKRDRSKKKKDKVKKRKGPGVVESTNPAKSS